MARKIAPIVLVVAAVLLLTQPAYLADTGRYIIEIQNHRAHLMDAGQDPFWDFGHAAWRPLVNAVYGFAGSTVESIRGGNERQALAWLMIAMNVLATMAAVLLLWLLLVRHCNFAAASLGAAAFLCTNSILDYSRSGAPYIPALAALVLALWLIQSGEDRQRAGRWGILWFAGAGLSLGAAVVLWFPFVLAVPAAILYALSDVKLALPSRRKGAAILIVFLGLSTTAVYAAVMHQRHIQTRAQFTKWVASSSNDWSQTDKLKRAVSGIPRSFLDLGDDTLLLKRYVFHDPYNPVTLRQILFAGGTIKLVLFYLYLGAVVVTLWKQHQERLVLLLAAGALPVLVFAVTLFEPGSTERYLPAYPFFFLAAAAALPVGGRRFRALQWAMAAFLIGVLCVGNCYGKLEFRGAAAYRAFLERKNILEAQAQPDSMVAVINFWDPLYATPPLRLLDSAAQPRKLWVYDVIEVANTRVFRWRQQFAGYAAAHWAEGRQVWLSKRLLADKPLPQWKWVEGDTGRVPWSAVREFFGSLDVADRVGGDDGFVLVAKDPRNMEFIGRQAGQP